MKNLTSIFVLALLATLFFTFCSKEAIIEDTNTEENNNFFILNSKNLKADLKRVDGQFKGSLIVGEAHFEGEVEFDHNSDNSIVSIEEQDNNLILTFESNELEEIIFTNFNKIDNDKFLFDAINIAEKNTLSFEIKDEVLSDLDIDSFKSAIKTELLTHIDHRGGGWCVLGGAIATVTFAAATHCNHVISTVASNCESGCSLSASFCSASCDCN